MDSVSREEQQYLIFELENHLFAISPQDIVEIKKLTTLTPVPYAEPVIHGMINHRGEIIPVINTKQLFYGGSTTDISKKIVIVLSCQRDRHTVMTGISVDLVSDMVTMKEEDIFVASDDTNPFIKAMYQQKDRIIRILNVGKMLDFSQPIFG